jgi:hypothetical protein
METVKQNDISKEQIELNLAINYMVIERVLRCMGIYNTVCDVHEGLDGKDGIFASAKDRSLLGKLLSLGETGLKVYLDEYHELFGLSYAVLLGQEQFQLGICIKDMDIYEKYKELHYTMIESLSKIVNTDEDLFNFPLPDNLDAIETHQIIDQALKQNIGSVKKNITKSVDLERLLKQLQFNPLGINAYGLFMELYLDEQIHVYTVVGDKRKEFKKPPKPIEPDSKAGERYRESYKKDVRLEMRYWTEVEKLFKEIFCNINQLNWKNKAAKDTEIINWKDNIYSLDSIIYSILRSQDNILVGGEAGEKKYHIFDKESVLLPYPLQFTNKTDSDLICVLDTLFDKTYTFADRKLELIVHTSIEREIKRYKEKIITLSTRKDRIQLETVNTETAYIEEIAYINKILDFYNNLDELTASDIDEYKAYVCFLEEQQKLFETNPKHWLKEYTNKLDGEQKLLAEQIQFLEKEIKQNDLNADNSLIYYMHVRNLERLKSRYILINEHKKVVVNKANQKKPIPFILTKEPYYEEDSIQKYKSKN